MPPIISVVGKSGAGKTTLLEKLIPELNGRGYRLAAAKHAAHGFQLDHPNKDSFRLVQAGASPLLLLSPNELALFQRLDREPPVEELSRFLGVDFDLLLVEGFRQGKATRIEVHRRELGKELLCAPEELWAVITDEPLELSLPQFSWHDIKGLADLIVKTFPPGNKEKMEVFLNGSPLSVNPFVQEIIARSLTGMLSTLKGVEEIKTLELKLRL